MTAVTGQVVVLNCAIKVTEFVGPNEKKKFTTCSTVDSTRYVRPVNCRHVATHTDSALVVVRLSDRAEGHIM